MNFVPKYYQSQCVDHLVANEVAALFVGMGLGKTASTLAALSHLIANGDCRGALIIAPLRVSLFTWPEELEKWEEFRWMRIVSLRTKEGQAAWENGDACIYTINYESLPKFLKAHVKGKRRTQLPVDTVVWDELSKAKSPRSKRINYFRRWHWDKFDRHWGLTGTPIPNSHLDLFAQIRLLDGGERFGTVFGNYRTRYFEPVDFNQYTWKIRKGSKELIEEKINDIVLTLRSEDHMDIPPTTIEDIPVKLPPEAMRLYKRMEKDLILLLRDKKIKAVNNAVLVNKLLQITSGAAYAEDISQILAPKEDKKVTTEIHDAKIKALDALHKKEGRKPMLVAIRYKHERDRICAALPYAQEFDGNDIDKWNRGEIKMWVAHPLSMSHGLNLQHGGSRACWATLGYSREEYDQFNGRIIRTGQENATRIFRLVCPGTIDDAAVAALRDKGETQEGFMSRLARRVELLTQIK